MKDPNLIKIWKAFSDSIDGDFSQTTQNNLSSRKVNIRIQNQLPDGYIIWEISERKVYAEFAEPVVRSRVGIYLNFRIPFEGTLKRHNWIKLQLSRVTGSQSYYTHKSDQAPLSFSNYPELEALLQTFYWSTIEFKYLADEKSVIGITTNDLHVEEESLQHIYQFARWFSNRN